MATPAGLRDIARYADVASPSKNYIVPRDAAGFSQPPTTFVRDAHAAGLDVVAYTFRAENSFLPTELRSDQPALDKPADYGNAFAEFQQFFDLGVDGVFTDNPDIAKAVRDDE
jgi:glycerophosphoryl diester phosphodiesterase